MSAVKRRVNSTGRKRIKRESIDIRLQASPVDGRPEATATLKLDEYEFASNARVIVEAYYKSSAMKVFAGPLASLAAPVKVHLTEVDNPWASLFRVKIVDSGIQTGKILGSADRLRPNGDEDADGRRSIFPIRECDLGDEVWRVDIDDDAGPMLMLNNQVTGFTYRILENPLVGGVLLPAAFRAVLTHIVENPAFDNDDADHWKALWLRFLKEKFGSDDDVSLLKGEDAENWVADNVKKFCEWKAFIQRIRVHSEGESP